MLAASLLAGISTIAAAQSQYCAQHISGGSGYQCFPTEAEATTFLRTEPTPEIGVKFLERMSASPLAGNRISVQYQVRFKEYESLFGDWYFAWNVAGGSSRNCNNNRVPIYNIVNYGCVDEAAVINDLLTKYPYVGLTSGGTLGDYGPTPPQSWAVIPYDAVSGKAYVSVVSNGRSLDIRNGAVHYSSEPLQKTEYFACPRLYEGTSPTDARAPWWPQVCIGPALANISVYSSQYNSCTRDGNPCVAATGNKEYRETDFQWDGLPFRRAYNSIRDLPLHSGMGDNWAHTYSDRLVLRSNLSSNMLWLRSDGYFELFTEVSSGVFTSNNDLGVKLHREPVATAATVGAWRLAQEGGRTLWFNDQGRMIRITDGGKTLTLAYCDAARLAARSCLSPDSLISVSSTTGRQLDFEYSTVHIPVGPLAGDTLNVAMLTRIRASGVPVADYIYDSMGRQTAAFVGDPTLQNGRRYLYAEASNLCVDGNRNLAANCTASHFPFQLTGVLDESGVRYTNYTYGAAGLVSSSEFAAGAGRVSLIYNANGAVDVTLPLGTKKSYAFTGGPFRKPTGTVFSVLNGPALSSNTKTYSGSRVQTAIGPTGSRMDYTYDAFHQTRRVEGLSAGGAVQPDTRTIQTDWHADLNLPIEERTYSSTNVLVARSTWTYNARGQAMTHTQHDPVTLQTRTTTTVYCEEPDVVAAMCPIVGLVRSVDGPRTDVNDTTTYSYYSDTSFTGEGAAAQGHFMGDLATVTNAAGKVTQYTKYNKHGQVLESVDPNGVVTINTYDLRQRLLSSTVADQTTSYSYDPVGQLKKVTLPDQSWVGYDYDDAHRQVAVYDHKGNRTDYTLDNAGNRTGETTKDPSGALKRQLSRSIDALGRVQQTTGRE